MREARRFYLSEDTGNGMTALSVCADGYHMASLWEVYDVSNLEYAAVPQRSVSAHAPLLDQGSGPWRRSTVGFAHLSP